MLTYCVDKNYCYVCKANRICALITVVFCCKWCEAGKHEGSEQIYLNVLLNTVCPLDPSLLAAFWLSAALLWHLDAI